MVMRHAIETEGSREWSLSALRAHASAVFRPTWIAAAMFCLAALAVIAAASHYGPTIDEGAHIAAGMQWLDQHRYAYETVHPPLGRVADALGPYLAGARSTLDPNMWREGEGILREGGDPAATLALARLGTLSFLLLASAVVWRWSRRLGGDRAALGAVFLFLALPPVLAHAGLATTDMTVCGTLALATIAALRWLEHPDARRSTVAGAALALAMLSKFTAILYFPAALLPVLAWRLYLARGTGAPGPRPRAWLRGAVLAAAAMALVIWGGYRFSVGSLLYEPSLAAAETAAPAKPQAAHGLVYELAKRDIYPAPEFFRGLFNTARRVDAGARDDTVYLFGRRGHGSLWYFFPAVFAFKTPLPFLALGLFGAALLLRRSRAARDWRVAAPALAAAGILAASTLSPHDDGLRYLLPVYPPLAVSAGIGLAALARGSRRAKAVALALGLWAGANAVAAFPDYLPWFNALAGGAPERVAIDSDLDWGQDVKRLGQELRDRGIGRVHAALLEESEYDLRDAIGGYTRLMPGERVSGWVAVSQYMLRERPGYEWLLRYTPAARVGASILLYDIPGADGDGRLP